MKKVMILTTIFALTLSLASCQKEADVTYAPGTETVSVSLQSLNFASDGGQQTFDVKASHEFTAYSNTSWIVVTPANSIGPSGSVAVSVEANPTALARTGAVTIVAGGTRQQISVSQEAGASPIEAPIEGYKLVWNDEFEGTTLSGDWTVETKPAGWVNSELQEYVNDGDVLQVSNGTLKINLLKNGSGYKSARLYGRVSTGWTYGYIEARIKLPKGKGTWPAFWMMPVNYTTWPGDGEIDIMEHVGYDQDNIYSTIHCNKYNNTGSAIESGHLKVSGATSDFHVYAMEWTADAMTFYVDGQTILTYKNDGTGKDAWPFSAAFYPILNLAYGGAWGGQQGVDDSVLPATMEVDYVRIFQK